MASPAPLLRPPIPGSRNTSSPRVPKLGLSIPPSPHARPVSSQAMPPLQIPQRQAPPKLSLATPMGSQATPQEGRASGRRGPPLQIGPGLSASTHSGGSSDDSIHSRSNSFAASNPNISSSTNSSYFGQDPISAANSYYSSSSAGVSGGAGMERENSMQGTNILPDLEKLSLEKGRPLDVEDLDDAGWKAASKENRIIELGSLGEGAGGAVTRCILKGGKTVFALKVRPLLGTFRSVTCLFSTAHHHRPQPGCQEADCARALVQQELRLSTHLPLLWRLHGRHNRHHRHQHGVLRGWLSRLRLPRSQETRWPDRRESPRESGRRRAERSDIFTQPPYHSSRYQAQQHPADPHGRGQAL